MFQTFLPVIVVVILRIHTIEQNMAFEAVESYTKISGSSAATKIGVKLLFVLNQVEIKSD